MRLRDKVAIVTGAANGIGKRTARRFAEEGARVVVSDVQDEAGQAVVERIRADGGVASYVHCDILREDDLRALVAAAVGDLRAAGRCSWPTPWSRRPHGGGGHGRGVRPRHGRHAPRRLPGLQVRHPAHGRDGGGAIVCISSVHGLLPARSSLGYEVGKAALFNLCRQITVDYGPQGIRANAICPGGVQSRLEDERPDAGHAAHRYRREVYPARRLGWPLDIANACLYFASDEASWVTGQVLAVDGGLTSQLQDDLAFRLRDYLKANPDALE